VGVLSHDVGMVENETEQTCTKVLHDYLINKLPE